MRVHTTHTQLPLRARAPAGFSSRDEALGSGRDKLEALARLHIIPPVPVTRALWTHPFFST